MSRYVSPVNPAVFPHLTLVLLSIGLFFTAWFFVYPLTRRCCIEPFGYTVISGMDIYWGRGIYPHYHWIGVLYLQIK